jgi:hypothetical protein
MAIEIWRRVGYLARGLCQQQRRPEKRDVFRHFRSSVVDGGRRCAVPPYTIYYGIYLAG